MALYLNIFEFPSPKDLVKIGPACSSGEEGEKVYQTGGRTNDGQWAIRKTQFRLWPRPHYEKLKVV
jgi:hypothetical protein